MDLRDYQQEGVEQIREGFRSGQRRVLFWLATGGGKTHTFSYIMKEAVERGKRCLMVVRGRKLVDQASKRLFHEHVTHGVLMSGHWNFRPQAPIQICSIDTMMARNLRPKADIIIIDEAHQAVSDGYKEFMLSYPEAFVVAVTATPYAKKGFEHIADFIVHPITVQELIDRGYLVPPKYYAPSEPDLRGVKVSSSTGDYVTDQLADVMDQSQITGDIVSHWQKLASDRPTIAFAVSVAHSQHLVEQFVAAGVAAEHCDADTPESEREKIIKRLVSGETKVVSNVGILCTGVDIPPVACIIMARPTKSYNLYVQQAGRGTRVHPESGKRDFLLLDHAGNVHRHGFITDEPEATIEGQKQVTSLGPKPKTCRECFAISDAYPCPLCGWKPEPVQCGPREVMHVPGELQEITGPSPIQRYECERYCEERLDRALKRGSSPWKAFYETVEKHGEPAAKLAFFRICKRAGVDLKRKGQQRSSLGVGEQNADPAGAPAVAPGVEAGSGDGLPSPVGGGWPYK